MAHFESLEERRLLTTVLQAVAGQPAQFLDVDGDRITVRHRDYGGTQVFINSDTGVVEEIRISGGKVGRTRVIIDVRPARDGGGDGRLQVEAINGEELFLLRAPDVDLVGDGIFFMSARRIILGSITQEAGLIIAERHKDTRLRIDTIDTTGTMILQVDVRRLDVNNWIDGQLEIGGGLLRATVHGDFSGELMLDRGSFYDFTFERKNFLTRSITIRGLADGTISMPRTFFLNARFEQGTTEDFSFSTTVLGGWHIRVNGDLLGSINLQRQIRSFRVDGDVDANVNIRGVNRVRIEGSLDGIFVMGDNRSTRIDGDLDGRLTATFSRQVVIGGDMTGRASFLRNDVGDNIGVRRFTVHGKMDNALLTTRANMGNVRVHGGMYRSHIAAGAHHTLLGDQFPENFDDLKLNDQFRSSFIRSVRIGYDNSGNTYFEQSFILAFEIRRVRLGYAAPQDLGSPAFGVGALFIDSIRYKNDDGMTRSNDLKAFRITDGLFQVRRIPGTYPANE